MAIFDDPKKELQRLQQQLLAEEDEELDEMLEEFEEDYEEFFEEDYEDEYEQEDYLRHFSGGYGKSHGKKEKSIFDEIEDAFDEDDADEEPFAIFVEEKRNIFGKRKVISNKKGVSNRGFKIMILLEIIAILCIAIWWVVMQL